MTQPPPASSMIYDQSQSSNLDDTHAYRGHTDYPYSQTYTSADYDLQTVPEVSNEDYLTINTSIHSWEQLLGQTIAETLSQPHLSPSDSSNDVTTSFGFQQQEQYSSNWTQEPNYASEELNPEMDYETIIRSKELYYDPDPQVIRKTATDNSLIYTQNIKIQFLQPPPVDQGPLIIREVRPPQPPPPPPLVS